MNKPVSLWFMGPGIFVCFLLFLGALALVAVEVLPLEAARKAKQTLALLTWIWLYQVTSSVAHWKGRRRWPWFLLGLLSMWGVFATVVCVALLIADSSGVASPKRAAGQLALAFLVGLPLGYSCTLLLSWLLRRSAPLPDSPELNEDVTPESPSDPKKPAWAD